MLNKAGGAGFQVTAYTQTVADILAGIGNKGTVLIDREWLTLLMTLVMLSSP